MEIAWGVNVTKFELVKTVSYELSATVDVPEINSSEDLLAMIEREGESWIDWEQLDGNDEIIDVFMIGEP